MKRAFTLIEAMIAAAIIAILIVIVAAARQKPTLQVEKPTELQGYDIKSMGTFKAGYNDNIREILVITEKETGKKYLAITGCGVTELVKQGKTTAEE